MNAASACEEEARKTLQTLHRVVRYTLSQLVYTHQFFFLAHVNYTAGVTD